MEKNSTVVLKEENMILNKLCGGKLLEIQLKIQNQQKK